MGLRRVFRWVVVLAAVSPACVAPEEDDEVFALSCGPDLGGPPGPDTYREDWSTELDVPIIEPLTELVIGGDPVDDNFVNRGDVEVRFDGEPGRILVEVRRFTNAEGEQAALDNFDKLSLWAYEGPVAPPTETAEGAGCYEAWRDGCQIRAYFEGLQQPIRDGMDLRITLPPGSVESLVVTTSDSAVDDDYPNRGDVTVLGLEGSADILTGSGRTRIELGPNAQGSLSAITRGAGDMELLIPAGLWVEAELRNDQEGENTCRPIVGCEGGGICSSSEEEPGSPWDVDVVAHDGLGDAPYQATVSSTQCIEVSRVDDPEDAGMVETKIEGTVTFDLLDG